MQKRKFDELISHFNRNVSDMSIDRKYKIELLGMISAIGFAHEEELSTNLAEVGTDCSEFPNNSDTISRQAAIDAAQEWFGGLIVGSFNGLKKKLEAVPSAQPEIIRCRECKFASGDSRICMKFGHSPIGELDFCAWAERRTDG